MPCLDRAQLGAVAAGGTDTGPPPSERTSRRRRPLRRRRGDGRRARRGASGKVGALLPWGLCWPRQAAIGDHWPSGRRIRLPLLVAGREGSARCRMAKTADDCRSRTRRSPWVSEHTLRRRSPRPNDERAGGDIAISRDIRNTAAFDRDLHRFVARPSGRLMGQKWGFSCAHCDGSCQQCRRWRRCYSTPG